MKQLYKGRRVAQKHTDARIKTISEMCASSSVSRLLLPLLSSLSLPPSLPSVI